jgi:hypothetical protein
MKKNTIILCAALTASGLMQGNAQAMYKKQDIPFHIQCAIETFEEAAKNNTVFAAFFFNILFKHTKTLKYLNYACSLVKDDHKPFVAQILKGTNFTAETKKQTNKIILEGLTLTLREAIHSGNIEYVKFLNCLFSTRSSNNKKRLITFIDTHTKCKPFLCALASKNRLMMEYVKEFSSDDTMVRYLDIIRENKRQEATKEGIPRVFSPGVARHLFI